MNYVRLLGRSATEADLRQDEDGLEASFIIEIAGGDAPLFFQVRCHGAAALKLRRETEQGPLIGRHIWVTGSLGQEFSCGGAKTVFVEGHEVDLIEP